MQKKGLSVLLAAASLAAHAATNDAYNGAGAYINANSGWVAFQNLPTGGYAFSANAGYNFNRALAVEGGYAWLYSSQFGASQTNNIFDVAVRGTLPLSSIFSLYGRLGGGLNFMTWGNTAYAGTPDWYGNQNASVNFVGLAGLGASFKLSRHFNLRLEDTMYIPIGGGNATAGQTNLVSGGVQYNF